MSDELVKELTIAISRADDFGVKILTAAIALVRAETLEEAAKTQPSAPKFTGNFEEQAAFLNGWMEAMSAKRTAIRALVKP